MDADQARASLFCSLSEIVIPWIRVSRKLADIAYVRVEGFEMDIDVNNKSLLETTLKIIWRSLLNKDED